MPAFTPRSAQCGQRSVLGHFNDERMLTEEHSDRRQETGWNGWSDTNARSMRPWSLHCNEVEDDIAGGGDDGGHGCEVVVGERWKGGRKEGAPVMVLW